MLSLHLTKENCTQNKNLYLLYYLKAVMSICEDNKTPYLFFSDSLKELNIEKNCEI